MKFLPVILVLAVCVGKSRSCIAQSDEAQQLLLNVEKLAQLKAILKNMYDGYQVVSKGYNTIKDISQGNYKLHHAFFDALLQVSPTVRKYSRVGDIISYQRRIVQEQKKAFDYFKSSDGFTPEEITYMGGVYYNLFQQSLKNIDELIMVVTASRLRMSDDERLEAIDRVFEDVRDRFIFLQSFNNSTKLLAVQRMRAQAEVEISRKFSGVK